MTTELIIYTYDELKTFRDNVNNKTNKYTTVKLGADIDMNGDDWTPIGFRNSETYVFFTGTFDGQGHVISNMKINIADTDNLWLGLFGYTACNINNLILYNPIIYNATDNVRRDQTMYVSFLCCYNSQSINAINNCRIINGHININNTGKHITNVIIGCICAYTYVSSSSDFNIIGCYVEVELNIKGNVIPDFGGIARNNGFLNNCGVKITGIIDINLRYFGQALIFCGLTRLNSTTALQVNNCYVHMNFKFNIYARLMAAGYHQFICGIGYRYSGSSPQISNCYVISNIELNTSTPGSTYYYVSANAATTTNCYSLVNLLLRQYGKGNTTYLNNKSETLKYNVNYANDTEYKDSIVYNNTYTNSETLENDLQSGKICYLLNGDQSKINFYQSLNFDKYPVLDNRHYIVNNPSTNTYTNTSNTNYIYDIWTYDDLMQFKAAVNTIGRDAYENKKPVNLHKDFNLNNEKWTPILWFYGTFNGNGHKITNFYMDLVDVFMINDNENLWGLGFFAAAEKISNFSIETTITGSYVKNIMLYVATLAYHSSCENVNVFVTYDKCDIQINDDSSDFYCGGLCVDSNSDNDSFNNCKLNMYFRNSIVTLSSSTDASSIIYIHGLCRTCTANNCTVLLNIDDTNTITSTNQIYINGIAYLANVTQCSSYINCNNNFNTLLLSGFIYGQAFGNYNIINSYSFVNYSGTIKNNSCIAGISIGDTVNPTKCYSVFNCNVTIKGENNRIGGISTSSAYNANTGLSQVTNCYVDAIIQYTTIYENNTIGIIVPTNNIDNTSGYNGHISYNGETTIANIYVTGTKLSTDAFKSGEVCYKLNTAIGSTVFYQSINSNYYPTFNSNEWKVFYHSSKTPKYYNNIPEFNNTISSYADLITFRNLVNNGTTYENQTITLLSDIDITNDEWIPIGTSTNLFKGLFDGQNHKISNFKCYANNRLNQIGLFGNATYKIQNLIIEDVFIGEQINTKQTSDFGSLLGCLTKTTSTPTITNCHANNCKILIYELNSKYEFRVGGLIGNVNNAYIDNCGIKNCIIDIYGGSYIGGLIGWGNDVGGTITNSYSEVDITFQMAKTNFGCILGGLCCNNFITNYCYSINTIKVTNLINGTVSGLNSLGKCNNCYVKTNIDVEIKNPNDYITSINGLCYYLNDNSQYNYIDATIAHNILKRTGEITVSLTSDRGRYSNNYAINDRIIKKGTISPTYTYQGSSYNESLLAYQFRNGYVCYNLNNNTILSSRQSPFYQTLYSDPYPVLDNTHQPVYVYSSSYYNPIRVLSSLDNIKLFYQMLESGYTYENEIIEVSRSFNCSANTISPSLKEFKGTLEGNNYTISNFKLLTNKAYVGFINYNKGTIQNLRLDTIQIYSSSRFTYDIRVGFICGYFTAGNIINCHVRNGIFNIQNLSGQLEFFGGIVGHINSSNLIISKCSSEFTIKNLISTGSLLQVGGIVGRVGYPSNKIEYCYSKITGTLQIDNTTIANSTTSYYFGGISGLAIINNCYSIIDIEVLANLSAGTAVIGGINASDSTSYTVSNSYTDTNIKYYKSSSTSTLKISYITPYDTSSSKSTVFAVNNPLIQTGPYECTNAYITDTYYTPIIEHNFSDGLVCYGLNNNQSTNPVFYQRINMDKYPVLFGSTSTVSKINGIYASKTIGITNYQELKNIATLANSRSYSYSGVHLLNDIDMNNYVNGETWTPIGASNNPFTAIFYGNNHTIYNMIINSANQIYSGFIGCTNGPIRDLNIDSSCKIISLSTSTIASNQYIGMLCAEMRSATDIYSCNVKGYIDIKNFSGELRIGGISYYSYGGDCFNCNVETIITVESDYNALIQIGGISQGSAYTIRWCNIHPSINIINNVSNRTRNINIGGVVCNINTSNDNILETLCDTRINIIDPYYTSSSTYYNLNTILNSTTVRKAYIYSPGNLISINNQLFIESEANKKYTDISIDQIKNGYLCNNILDNNSDKKWYQNLREDYYPTLDSTHQKVTKIIDNQVYVNPKYNINSYEDFINFRNEINGITSNVTYSCDFYLNCDINLNNIEWKPINCYNHVTFTGTFYGNNHTISKLSLNHSSYQYTGLFGFCNGLKFKDLIINDSTISVTPSNRGEINGASFIGYRITTIDNCHVKNSYIKVLNGFNTDSNSEFYAGLGIGNSGYKSNVIKCTNCSVSLTYDITDTITRTSTKNIVISGLISNNILSNGSSVASSYIENYFTNCKADITFNNFYLYKLQCSCSGICCWFSYVKIENCNSNMNTKNIVIQLFNSTSMFAGILVNLYNENRYNIQINKCYSYMDIDYSGYNSYLCGIAMTSTNNSASQTESITNCYSNTNIELTNSIKYHTNIFGITYLSNISNCYSKLSCYFNKCAQSNTVSIHIGGISRIYDSTYGAITNCYSYLNVYGSITDSTAKVILYISGGASWGYSSSKPYIYSIPYTTAEINSALSGTYTLYNYCTTDYVTEITTNDFINGKVCYGLNGNQSTINFYQYLKESNYPTLDSNYPKVLLKNSSYINQETITKINNKYDLFLFRDSVNAGNNYAGTTININADIDLENMEWAPINNINYCGILQGNNHTISNFTIQNQEYCGFFALLSISAEIHNLTLDNVTIQGLLTKRTQSDIDISYCGVLCSLGRDINISNCNITNCKIDVTYSNNSILTLTVLIGGLSGIAFVYDNECKITNCNVINTSIKITYNSDLLDCYVCGLFTNRIANKNTQLINSSFIGDITIDNTDGINTRPNYICGLCDNSTNINSCYTINSIKIINGRRDYISGISNSKCTITNTYCKSIINASSYTTTNNQILISGIAYADVSTTNINNVYADNQIFYNNQTTDATKIQIGQISCNETNAETVANSTISIVPNQIINLGTTAATITDKVTGYNTIRKEDFNNGKVCYGLNTNGTYFYQIIGMDAYPVLTNNNSTIKRLTISMHPSPLDEFYYNNDFDGNIYSYYDLCLFRNLVNSGTTFLNQTINLLCDIDMNGDEWIPIGVNGYPFRGSFNGNNHVIKNMVLRLNLSLGTTASTRYIGLFGEVGTNSQTGNILIRDIIIDKSCQMKYDSYSGTIYCSYVIGALNEGTIDNCKVYANVNLNNNKTAIYYGSFAGIVPKNKCIISNCYVNNNVVINNSKTIFIYGIVFMHNTSSSKTSKLINNSCIMNIRITHKSTSSITLTRISITGLSYNSLSSNNIDTIDPNNCNNNYCLMNTTILNEVDVSSVLNIYYSIDKLNSNNYVNNDYPFIKNPAKALITLGSYDSEDFKSGKICYLLNGNQSNIKFYQNLEINKDIAPIPDNSHQQVYKSTTDGIDTYYNRPLNELPTQQLALTTYNLANQSTPLYNYDPNINSSSTNLYLDKINFALSTKNNFYSITQPLEKYFYDIYHSSKKYKIHTNNIMRLNFHLFNQLIQSKITIGDVIMYNEIFAKLINNLPVELIKTELNYYKRLCFYLRDKNALDSAHYNLIFGNN